MRYRVRFVGEYIVEANSEDEAEIEVLPAIEADPAGLIPVAEPIWPAETTGRPATLAP